MYNSYVSSAALTLQRGNASWWMSAGEGQGLANGGVLLIDSKHSQLVQSQILPRQAKYTIKLHFSINICMYKRMKKRGRNCRSNCWERRSDLNQAYEQDGIWRLQSEWKLFSISQILSCVAVSHLHLLTDPCVALAVTVGYFSLVYGGQRHSTKTSPLPQTAAGTTRYVDICCVCMKVNLQSWRS